MPRSTVTLVERLRLPAEIAIDVGVALLLATPALAQLRSNNPTAMLLAALPVLPLVVRRVWPVPVFVLVLAGYLATEAADLRRDLFLGVAAALYTVAARTGRRWSVPALVLSLAGVVAADLSHTWMVDRDASWAISAGALVTAGWVIGVAVRAQRRQAEERDRRQARDELLAERLRIARELHDVVAHGMGVIAVQAGVAHHVVDSHPEEARAALASIAESSRTGLAELRRVLSALRSAEDDPVDGLRPAPGLSDVEDLVARAGRAGVPVTLSVLGTPRPVPAGVALAGYRIVQEALTNMLRHAGATRGEVVLDHRSAGTLRVEVTDDGRSPHRHAGSGHGLAGMRERAALYGGTLAAGPRPAPERGFRVEATLPVDATPADPPRDTAVAP